MRHVQLRVAFAIVCGLGLVGMALLSPSLATAQSSATGVVVSNFSVKWNHELKAVEISWETAAEFGTLGFTVERAISQSGTYSQVLGFEPAVGDSLTGAYYGPFFDTEIVTETRYWYRLVVYDRDAIPDFSIPPIAVITDLRLLYLPTIRCDP